MFGSHRDDFMPHLRRHGGDAGVVIISILPKLLGDLRPLLFLRLHLLVLGLDLLLVQELRGLQLIGRKLLDVSHMVPDFRVAVWICSGDMGQDRLNLLPGNPLELRKGR